MPADEIALEKNSGKLEVCTAGDLLLVEEISHFEFVIGMNEEHPVPHID